MRGFFWFLQSFWITIYTMTTIPIIYEHILNDFFNFLKDWLKRTEPNAYLGVIDSTVVFQMKLLCLLCLKAPWWRGKPLNFKLVCPWQTQHFITLQITSLMIISGMNTLSQSNAQHTSHIKGALNRTPRHTDSVDMRLMTHYETLRLRVPVYHRPVQSIFYAYACLKHKIMKQNTGHINFLHAGQYGPKCRGGRKSLI